MKELSGAQLLEFPVRLRGIKLAYPVDLLFEREGLRAVGLDVVCGDEVNRFLPLLTANVGDDALTISSPLLLFDKDQLAFYRSRSVALSALHGRVVLRARREVGVLRDVLLAPDGELVAVVVEQDGRRERVAFDESVELAPASRSAA